MAYTSIVDKFLDTLDGDYGIIVPPCDAEKALEFICTYVLGDTYITVNPISTDQRNTEMVCETLRKIENMKRKKFFRKGF